MFLLLRLLGSYILDDSRYKRTRRAWIGCAILSFSTMIVWGGGVFWEVKRQVSDNSISNSLDVLETTVQWAPGFLLYLAYGFYDAIFQTYAYWIMGALTNDAYRLSRYAGFYKSIQSAFGAVSWQLSNILYFRTNTLAWLLVTAAPCALSCFLFALIIWLYVEDTCEREDSIEPNQKNY